MYSDLVRLQIMVNFSYSHVGKFDILENKMVVGFHSVVYQKKEAACKSTFSID